MFPSYKRRQTEDLEIEDVHGNVICIREVSMVAKCERRHNEDLTSRY